MFPKSRLVVVVCCGVAVTALSGTAAPVAVVVQDTGKDKPSRIVLRDGTGDVWKVNMRTSHWTPVGDRPAADVLRAVVQHRTRSVVVRARYENLRRIGVQNYWVGIKTPEDDFFTEVKARPGNRAGRHALYDGVAGERLDCAGFTHRIDYATDTVTVRVPRSCLDGPRWVRADIGNLLVVGDRPHRRGYADNPHDDGPYSNVGTKRIYRDSPALADMKTHRDSIGDVILIGPEDGSLTPQPSWKGGDITRIRVAHRAARVVVRMAFRDVARRMSNSYFYRIKTPKEVFLVDGYTDADHPQGGWFVGSETRKKSVACPGLRHLVDYTTERVKISVPRACLRRPGRVRVGAFVQTWVDAKEQSRRDDGYSAEYVEGTLGPWVRRGR